jgi:hypothetical protein
MFDCSLCQQMKQDGLVYASSAALLALKDLLRTASVSIESTTVEAQHLSSSSGDADAHSVTIQSPSRRVVCSASEAAAVAAGSTSEDGAPAGPDVERTSGEAPFLQRRTSGGGR